KTLPTTTLSSTQLRATVSGSDAQPGSIGIRVMNPNGDVSGDVRVSAIAIPIIDDYTPRVVTAGVDFTVKVTGRGFASGAVIQVFGTAAGATWTSLTTTALSSSQLQATVSGSVIAQPGSVGI